MGSDNVLVLPFAHDRVTPALDAFNQAAERMQVTLNALLELVIDERTKPHPAQVRAHELGKLNDWLVSRILVGIRLHEDHESLGAFLRESCEDAEKRAEALL